MNLFVESLKALLFGIVEGITEWLPISSTGHMILLDEFIQLQMSDAFKSMFEVVIQLGAILAVVVLYFPKLWPFKKPKKGEGFVGLFKMETIMLWVKVVVAILPSAIVGIPFDDWMDAHLHNAPVVAAMLVIYGVAFILVEKKQRARRARARADGNVSLGTQSAADNSYVHESCLPCLQFVLLYITHGRMETQYLLFALQKMCSARFVCHWE